MDAHHVRPRRGGRRGPLRGVRSHLSAGADRPAGRARRYVDCLRLNARVLTLAGTGQWVGRSDTQRSYDRLAPAYDENWLCHLAPVTQELLRRIPAAPAGPALDLGCGTGLTVEWLAQQPPEREIVAVDRSAGMLAAARRRCTGAAGRVRFERADRLAFLRDRPPASAGLIVAAWSIGYSRPAQVIARSARVLAPGGVFAFVVNYADSLRAVYRAFRRTMGRHPGALRRLAWPRFPRNAAVLRRAFDRAGFAVEWWHDGAQPIPAQPDGRGRCLPWLLRTGVLAGFDAMLPLAEPGPVADDFERGLREAGEPIVHRYGAGIARRAP